MARRINVVRFASAQQLPLGPQVLHDLSERSPGAFAVAACRRSESAMSVLPGAPARPGPHRLARAPDISIASIEPRAVRRCAWVGAYSSLRGQHRNIQTEPEHHRRPLPARARREVEIQGARTRTPPHRADATISRMTAEATRYRSSVQDPRTAARYRGNHRCRRHTLDVVEQRQAAPVRLS